MTVCIHVIAEQALTSRNKRIRVDESTDFGIVVSGLEVIELGLNVLK